MKGLGAVFFSMAALAAMSSVGAKEKYKEVVNAGTRDLFEQVATGVRKDMETGGRYEFVSPDERTTIEKNLGAIDALFQQHASVEEMKQDEKVKLFNAQENVNSILTKRDSERVICESRAPVGSHIPVTTCHTFGQEQEARRGTKKVMQDWSLIRNSSSGDSFPGRQQPGSAAGGK